jgi:hypothetical protein
VLDQDRGSGLSNGFRGNFHDRKTFTCDDGSGTFTANVQAHEIFSSSTITFTWNILSGTGAYGKLHGSGHGVSDLLPDALVDNFTGALHFD